MDGWPWIEKLEARSDDPEKSVIALTSATAEPRTRSFGQDALDSSQSRLPADRVPSSIMEFLQRDDRKAPDHDPGR